MQQEEASRQGTSAQIPRLSGQETRAFCKKKANRKRKEWNRKLEKERRWQERLARDRESGGERTNLSALEPRLRGSSQSGEGQDGVTQETRLMER